METDDATCHIQLRPRAGKHIEIKYLKKKKRSWGPGDRVKHSKGSQSRLRAIIKAPSGCAWGCPPTVQPTDCSGGTLRAAVGLGAQVTGSFKMQVHWILPPDPGVAGRLPVSMELQQAR